MPESICMLNLSRPHRESVTSAVPARICDIVTLLLYRPPTHGKQSERLASTCSITCGVSRYFVGFMPLFVGRRGVCSYSRSRAGPSVYCCFYLCIYVFMYLCTFFGTFFGTSTAYVAWRLSVCSSICRSNLHLARPSDLSSLGNLLTCQNQP